MEDFAPPPSPEESEERDGGSVEEAWALTQLLLYPTMAEWLTSAVTAQRIPMPDSNIRVKPEEGATVTVLDRN